MSDESFTEEEITGLLTRLEHVEGLSERQQTLLNAIVKMFKDVEAAEIPAPEPVDRIPFESTFLPGRAKVVMDYANPESDSESPTAKYPQIAQYITRTTHP